MKNFNFFLVFFLILPFYSIQSQNVIICGSGKGYGKEELKFYQQTDPITKNQKPLFRIVCDENGSFSTRIQCSQTSVISIKTGIYRLFLHIKDGDSLSINLPDFIAIPPGEEQNPFYIETRVIPEVVNKPGNINNLMKTYDSEYDPVFNLVAERVTKRYKKEEIPSLIESLNKVSSDMSPEFNASYVSYRLIMLNMVANGTYPGRVEDSVLINRNFLPDNQAYIDLVEQIFTGYFRNIAAGKLKDSFVNAISNSSLDELRKLILRDGKAVNDQLRDYIITLNLTNDFYNGSITAVNVLNILRSLSNNGSSTYIKSLAASISVLLSSSLPGSKPAGFNLAGSDGRMHSPEEFKGKYVLISFARTDSQSAILELGLMKNWLTKYQKDLQTITILTDRDFVAATGRIRRFGFGWLFLDGSESDMIEYQYNIKTYPSFILLDREGKIVYDPAPFPSENLETVIESKLGIIQN